MPTVLLGTRHRDSVRNDSKFKVKPTYFTVVKAYEKVAQPLKLTISSF